MQQIKSNAEQNKDDETRSDKEYSCSNKSISKSDALKKINTPHGLRRSTAVPSSDDDSPSTTSKAPYRRLSYANTNKSPTPLN